MRFVSVFNLLEIEDIFQRYGTVHPLLRRSYLDVFVEIQLSKIREKKPRFSELNTQVIFDNEDDIEKVNTVVLIVNQIACT